MCVYTNRDKYHFRIRITGYHSWNCSIISIAHLMELSPEHILRIYPRIMISSNQSPSFTSTCLRQSYSLVEFTKEQKHKPSAIWDSQPGKGTTKLPINTQAQNRTHSFANSPKWRYGDTIHYSRDQNGPNCCRERPQLRRFTLPSCILFQQMDINQILFYFTLIQFSVCCCGISLLQLLISFDYTGMRHIVQYRRSYSVEAERSVMI